MSFAYLPLYTGDYLRKTRHLSPGEHGTYLLLLMHMWDTQEPIPLDEQRVCSIINARSTDEVEVLRRVLAEPKFFVKLDDGYYNERVFKEIERFNSISNKRSGAARKRWSARDKLKKIKGISLDANAMQMQCKSTSPALSPSPSPVSSNTKSKALLSGKPDRAAAVRLLNTLNKHADRAYRPTEANLRLILARLGEGFSESDIEGVIKTKCLQWGPDEKMSQYLRPKTLFTASNFSSYCGAVAQPRGWTNELI